MVKLKLFFLLKYSYKTGLIIFDHPADQLLTWHDQILSDLMFIANQQYTFQKMTIVKKSLNDGDVMVMNFFITVIFLRDHNLWSRKKMTVIKKNNNHSFGHLLLERWFCYCYLLERKENDYKIMSICKNFYSK